MYSLLLPACTRTAARLLLPLLWGAAASRRPPLRLQQGFRFAHHVHTASRGKLRKQQGRHRPRGRERTPSSLSHLSPAAAWKGCPVI